MFRESTGQQRKRSRDVVILLISVVGTVGLVSLLSWMLDAGTSGPHLPRGLSGAVIGTVVAVWYLRRRHSKRP